EIDADGLGPDVGLRCDLPTDGAGEAGVVVHQIHGHDGHARTVRLAKYQGGRGEVVANAFPSPVQVETQAGEFDAAGRRDDPPRNSSQPWVRTGMHANELSPPIFLI